MNGHRNLQPWFATTHSEAGSQGHSEGAYTNGRSPDPPADPLARAEAIVANMECLDAWEDRYGYLIELGRALPPFPQDRMNDEHKVTGCLSQVWLWLRVEDGHVRMRATSDAAIVSGLIAVLMAMYDGQEVTHARTLKPAEVFTRLNLSRHLSIGRRNGLESMIARIQRDLAS